MAPFWFGKRLTLPEQPMPEGLDVFVGNDTAGITAREALYLEQLKQAGLRLEAPRKVTFAIACRTEEAIAQTTHALKDSGLTITVSRPTYLPFLAVFASSKKLALVPGIAQLSPLMWRIDDIHDVAYDGWFAKCPEAGCSAKIMVTVALKARPSLEHTGPFADFEPPASR